MTGRAKLDAMIFGSAGSRRPRPTRDGRRPPARRRRSVAAAPHIAAIERSKAGACCIAVDQLRGGRAGTGRVEMLRGGGRFEGQRSGVTHAATGR